jgi:hypothetical protein
MVPSGARKYEHAPRRFPFVDGADKLDAFRLQALASRFDVVDEKPDDRFLRGVGVLGVGGTEEPRLAAVWKPEERELACLVLERGSQGVPVKVAISL